MKNNIIYITLKLFSTLEINSFRSKKASLVIIFSTLSTLSFSQLTVNDAQLCTPSPGMFQYVQGDSYITNNTGHTLELLLTQVPAGSSLQQGMNYSMGQSLNYSEEGLYSFNIIDSLGLIFGRWNVENFYQQNVNAGSSSIDICENDTVPLVGNIPGFSYYFLQWTQIDNLPQVNWVGASNVQIAMVTNFQTPGTYTFEYTINPGTGCSSSDVMTITVIDCDSTNSISEINANLTVYPSIVKDELNVSNSYSDNLHLQLIDFSGRNLISEKISIGNNVIPVQNFPKGMYIYRISDNMGQMMISGKIIIP